VRLSDFPVEMIPRNAFRNVQDVIGRILKTTMVQGEILLEHNLADPTNVQYDLAFAIADNHVLMAFPASDLMSSLSIVQRGDIIDIFATTEQEMKISEEGAILEDETASRRVTFDAFQNVSITAMVVDIVKQEEETEEVEGPQPTPSPSQIRIKAYLLALDPQDALVLKYLKDEGATFDIVLRSPTSTETFDLSPVMEEYITELYRLEIIR
jgi:pilus assembly protein CpaB